MTVFPKVPNNEALKPPGRIVAVMLMLALSLSTFPSASAGAGGPRIIVERGSPETLRHPLLSTLPLSLTDDRGHSVRLKGSATRIISLSPSITELLFEAGAGEKLVGVSRYSDYPEAARHIPDVGDSSHLDLERIIALKPDLVIAWRSGNALSDIEKLERLGLTVFAIEAVRLEDIPRLLRIAGQLAGTPAQAEPAASDFEETLRQFRHRYRNQPKVKVFQLIWYQPLMTINGSHIISDLIELCGGVNIFASLPSLTPVISAENLIEADPQVIISSISRELAESEVKILLRRFSHIRAVKHDHLYFVSPDLIHRQTARLLQAAEAVCVQLENARQVSEMHAMRWRFGE